MLKAVAAYLAGVPPIFIDGALYVGVAFFGAWAAAFATDEAAKYIAAFALFWLRASCASISASLLALKMFRSTSYADHQKHKQDTARWFKEPSNPPPPQPS